MDPFFPRKSIFLFLFLFIYFSPIVVGPSIHDPNFSPNFYALSILTTEKQIICFEEIHKVFKIDLRNREYKKEYLDYATRYLRYLYDNELLEYIADLKPQDEIPGYFLFNGNSAQGGVIYNEYAYKYFTLMSDKYDIDNIPTSLDYCSQYQVGNYIDNYVDCQHAILYYDLGGEDLNATVRHALSSIVILDITLKNYNNPNFFLPDNIIYAEMYMDEIAKKILTDESIMPWPEEFCHNNYD